MGVGGTTQKPRAGSVEVTVISKEGEAIDADCFFSYHIVVRHEYTLEGQTAYKQYYLELLQCPHNAVD